MRMFKWDGISYRYYQNTWQFRTIVSWHPCPVDFNRFLDPRIRTDAEANELHILQILRDPT